MSRLAQAVSRAVAELKTTPRTIRPVKPTAAVQQQQADIPSAYMSPPADVRTLASEEKPVPKRAKKKVTVKPRKRARGNSVAQPTSADELTFKSVTAEKHNRYVTLEFTNGFVVRLKPVNLPPKETFKLRDVLVSYFQEVL